MVLSDGALMWAIDGVDRQQTRHIARGELLLVRCRRIHGE